MSPSVQLYQKKRGNTVRDLVVIFWGYLVAALWKGAAVNVKIQVQYNGWMINRTYSTAEQRRRGRCWSINNSPASRGELTRMTDEIWGVIEPLVVSMQKPNRHALKHRCVSQEEDGKKIHLILREEDVEKEVKKKRDRMSPPGFLSCHLTFNPPSVITPCTPVTSHLSWR